MIKIISYVKDFITDIARIGCCMAAFLVGLVLLTSIAGMIFAPSRETQTKRGASLYIKTASEFETWLVKNGMKPVAYDKTKPLYQQFTEQTFPLDYRSEPTLPEEVIPMLTRHFNRLALASGKLDKGNQTYYSLIIFSLFLPDSFGDHKNGPLRRQRSYLENFRQSMTRTTDISFFYKTKDNAWLSTTEGVNLANRAVLLAMLGQKMRELESDEVIVPAFVRAYENITSASNFDDVENYLHSELNNTGLDNEKLERYFTSYYEAKKNLEYFK